MGFNYGRYDSPQVPVIKNVRGVKIAFLAYCTWGAICKPRTMFKSGPAVYTKDSATRDVHALRKKNDPDIVVIFLHWGKEYIEQPTTEQRTIAKELIALNVSMVIGSHSHRIEKHCFHGDSLVSYGLGNFLFPPYGSDGNHEIFNWPEKSQRARKLRNKHHVRIEGFEERVQSTRNPTTRSMILRVTVNKQGIVNAQYLPVVIRFHAKKKLFQPTPVSKEWISVCSERDTHCLEKKQTCV
ncbi:PGA biosynthesis protein CapA-like [Nematostella vectensis]|uniref:PGA biosynthesis protein CapA-like n=1 Tax=Nematostella vectensis TaxID=45351 RepID=UPI00207797CE|nr:PGA biosynthesis protein CapA-like [Nematostella vectensis]